MNTKIYGIAAAQNVDNSGETLLIDSLDTAKMNKITDEHNGDAWSIIGSINFNKKIHSLSECEDDKQRRCWEKTKVPFLYVEGELADGSGHPNAKAAASLLKFTSGRPDLPLTIGMSIEGGILERSGTDNKTLSKAVATAAAFTVKPCNPKCALFLENDLQKSLPDTAPPPEYIEALKKSEATTSFRETPKVLMLMYLESLKKSVADYVDGFTSMKCFHCNHGFRFFKSSKEIPNRCPHCGSAFSLSSIWDAMQR